MKSLAGYARAAHDETTEMRCRPYLSLYDGCTDSPVSAFQGAVKTPSIPPRVSSLQALVRSGSSESLEPLITVEEVPSQSSFSPSLGSVDDYDSAPIVTLPETPINVQTPEISIEPVSFPTPRLLTPLPSAQVAPEVSLQPTIATPVLIIPPNENPFDFALVLEEGRGRRASADSVDSATDTGLKLQPVKKLEKSQARNLLGVRQSSDDHVGWRSDFLSEVRDPFTFQNGHVHWARRRSSSLPDLPVLDVAKGWKSVKGRRATPYVHNVGIGGTNGNSKGGGNLAFSTLKRLSEDSTRRLSESSMASERVESGFEVWFDAVEDQTR